MQTTYAEIFEDIAESLTEKNWTQKSFFAPPRDGATNVALCMCAHGALQARINPAVQKFMLKGQFPTVHVRYDVAARDTTPKLNSHLSSSQIWDLRDYSYRMDVFDGTKGKPEAHYLLVMVGLTYDFNDHPGTTVEMVKAKFQEAAQLARELGV